MDYTVGSLADLITGSNTPNKPKVIQKGFIPLKVKKEENGAFNSSPKKTLKIKKEVSPGNDEFANEVKVKKAKKRKIENTVSSDFIEATENSPYKKPKLNKKKKKKIGVHNNGELEVPNEIKDEKKSKKRKIEESKPNDFVDSDEDSSAKVIELSQNDLNAERRIKKKKKEQKQIDPVDLSKTLFVGNVPIKTPKKKIQKFFKKYGEIEAIRIRGIPVADPKIPKKTAAIKKEFHPNRNSVLCYIRFKKPEDVIKAEEVNGTLFEGHHLRVQRCGSSDKPDESKAIFVGNLSFDAEEEELWKLFESCGSISYVRVIRDTYSGMGKGFAYVNFKDSDAVQLALEMEGVKLKNRELRVSLCNASGARKNKGVRNKNKNNGFDKRRFRKPFNKSNEEENPGKEGGQYVKQKSFNKHYQGSQFTDKKKKHKINKGLLEKKMKVKKIAPKPVLETAG